MLLFITGLARHPVSSQDPYSSSFSRIKADADRCSHLPAAAHGTGAGGTDDAAEKMCFIFPIRADEEA
jgi:hypothetical protein